ncbi:MAG: rhodanese-like domain-containing protein [Acidiferrobacterales bacterium]
MSSLYLPLIVSPQQLAGHLEYPDLLLVDLCSPEIAAVCHLPDANFVDYRKIVRIDKPVVGLVPDAASLSALLASIGATPDKFIVAYDDEGGGRAARFLWTLEVLGHKQYALLDGGIIAWAAGNFPISRDITLAEQGNYPVSLKDHATANHTYILDHLNNADVAIVDTRTPAEFSGEKKLAARAGHIPGAINFNWVDAMDPHRDLQLIDAARLRSTFESMAITPDKEIIVYCQSHHRSAHTFMVLKHLGYTHLRGYAGAWSDWGNRTDTPVE